MLQQVLEEPADRHVGERQELVEGDAEARAELPLVVFFELPLRRRERGAQGVINQVQHQACLRPAVAETVQPLQRLDAFRINALAALRVHVLLEVAGQGGDDLDLMVSKEFGQVAFPVYEKDREIRPVNHAATEGARFAHQVFEIRVEFGSAARDVYRRYVVAGEHRDHSHLAENHFRVPI